MDPTLGIPLTVTLTFEQWVDIADVMTAAQMYRDRLPAWAITAQDISAAEELQKAVRAFSDLRVAVNGND